MEDKIQKNVKYKETVVDKYFYNKLHKLHKIHKLHKLHKLHKFYYNIRDVTFLIYTTHNTTKTIVAAQNIIPDNKSYILYL